MAKTGIDRYDELPGAVGWKDVDSARAAYSILDNSRFPRLHSFLMGFGVFGWPRLTVRQHKRKIIERLEAAREKYED